MPRTRGRAWHDEGEMLLRRFPPLVFVLALASAGAGQNPLSGADPKEDRAKSPSYQEDVRPLFQAKCVRCHGGKAPKGDLDLSTPAGARKGGESGPAIVAGKPEESPLYEKVHGGSMPPAKKDRLSEAEVETLRRWIAAGARFGPGEGAAAGPALTQHDVLPILLRRCTACHGPRRQEAGLDLWTRAAMLRGGKSGPAVVPGMPEESLVVKKVRAGAMPPRDRLVEASVKPIEPAEIEVLVRWIAAGAPEAAIAPDVATTKPDPLVTDKDRDFWSFRPPRPVAVPTVRHTDRVRNPIDAFILQKLEQK